MSEPDAASAGEKPAPSNLVMRVLAALVLAPLAIALAYAGGWLWALLVTLVSIGLFAEWLMVVGAGSTALTGAGTIAIAMRRMKSFTCRGGCFDRPVKRADMIRHWTDRAWSR